MQVGSLVECVRRVPEWVSKLCQVPNNPVVKNTYTVRDTEMIRGELCVRLEEIENPPNKFFNNREPFFYGKDFVEIQPPMDISELVKESINEPVTI